MNNRKYHTVVMLASCLGCIDSSDTPIDTSADDSIEMPDTDTSDIETSTETSSDSSDDTETTTGMPCEVAEDCLDPGSPFCSDGECRSCADLPEPDFACAQLDPTMPVCVDGSCEQCDEDSTWACPEALPNCDIETNTCTGCEAHDDCPDSACDLDSGTCFPWNVVVHVDGDDAADFSTIEEAIDAYPEDVVIVLHELGPDGFDFYVENVSISGGRRVAILAAPDEQPLWTSGPTDEPTLRIGGGSQAFLRGLRLETNYNERGLEVSAAEVWLQQSRVVGSELANVFVGGVGSLRIENSFIGGGLAANDAFAVHVVNGSVDIVYSTLGSGPVAALKCAEGASVRARNSVIVATVVAPTAEIQCPWADLADNAIEMQWGSNVALGKMSPSWFVGYTFGDFHLENGQYPIEIATAARWREGDPDVDVDGDPRSIDGSPDFAGADIP